MNKKVKQIKPMVCPVCKKFYFSKLLEDEIRDGESPNSVQCTQCGWYYDLEQTKDPNLVGQSNELSLNKYIEKYKEILKNNPKYVYLDANKPAQKPHKCPVCGEHMFKDEGSFDVCPICGWEDDGYYEAGGANEISLQEYIAVFNKKRSINPKYKWKDLLKNKFVK